MPWNLDRDPQLLAAAVTTAIACLGAFALLGIRKTASHRRLLPPEPSLICFSVALVIIALMGIIKLATAYAASVPPLQSQPDLPLLVRQFHSTGNDTAFLLGVFYLHRAPFPLRRLLAPSQVGTVALLVGFATALLWFLSAGQPVMLLGTDLFAWRLPGILLSLITGIFLAWSIVALCLDYGLGWPLSAMATIGIGAWGLIQPLYLFFDFVHTGVAALISIAGLASLVVSLLVVHLQWLRTRTRVAAFLWERQSRDRPFMLPATNKPISERAQGAYRRAREHVALGRIRYEQLISDVSLRSKLRDGDIVVISLEHTTGWWVHGRTEEKTLKEARALFGKVPCYLRTVDRTLA